jgi:hypothetical protein
MTKTVGWYVCDFEGNYVTEGGKPKLYTDEKEAKDASKRHMGPIVPVKEGDIVESEEEEPLPADDGLTDLERLFVEVEAEARKRAAQEYPKARGKKREAAVAHNMIGGVQVRRQNLIAIEMAAVIEAGRGSLWQSHPKRFDSFKDFLEDAGVSRGRGRFYELSYIGETVVPFLDEHGVRIEEHLSDRTIGWTLEAASYMNKQIGDGVEPDEVVGVLDWITQANTREDVRDEYRQRRPKSANGRFNKIKNGALLVIMYDDIESALADQRRLTKVDWRGIVTSVEERENSLRVVIS